MTIIRHLTQYNLLDDTSLSLITGGNDDKNNLNISATRTRENGTFGSIDYTRKAGNGSMTGSFETNGHVWAGTISSQGRISDHVTAKGSIHIQGKDTTAALGIGVNW